MNKLISEFLYTFFSIGICIACIYGLCSAPTTYTFMKMVGLGFGYSVLLMKDSIFDGYEEESDDE